MILKDIAIGIFDRKNPNQLKFNKETWCITSLYLRCLSNKYDAGSYGKALIYVTHDEKKINKIEKSLDVISVNLSIDLEDYFKLVRVEKKEASSYSTSGTFNDCKK